MRKTAVRAVAGAVIVAANVALIEILAAASFLVQTGELIWFRPSSEPAPPSELPTAAIGTRGLTLSPYFGYTTRVDETDWAGLADRASGIGSYVEPSESTDCSTMPAPEACLTFQRIHAVNWYHWPELWGRNEYGLRSSFHYPIRDIDERAFVIGVFGGSVATAYAYWAIDPHSAVLKGLEEALDRPVVVLNFAIGGEKQPQQVQKLVYFASLGQRFDLILNIDGFNEAYVSWLNIERAGIDYSQPSAALVNTTIGVYLDGLIDQQIRPIQARRDRLTTIAHSTRWAAIHYVTNLLAGQATDSLRQIEAEWTQQRPDDLFPLSRISAQGDFADNLASLAEMWAGASIQMAAIARQMDAIYLHVLQPNQYFSNKNFTEEELLDFNVLGEGDAPLATIVPMAYRAFLAHSGYIQSNSVNFINATGIFDEVEGSIYHDWCCHFNEPGFEILDLVIQYAILRLVDPDGYADRRSEIERLFSDHAHADLDTFASGLESHPRDLDL